MVSRMSYDSQYPYVSHWLGSLRFTGFPILLYLLYVYVVYYYGEMVFFHSPGTLMQPWLYFLFSTWDTS